MRSPIDFWQILNSFSRSESFLKGLSHNEETPIQENEGVIR